MKRKRSINKQKLAKSWTGYKGIRAQRCMAWEERRIQVALNKLIKGCDLTPEWLQTPNLIVSILLRYANLICIGN